MPFEIDNLISLLDLNQEDLLKFRKMLKKVSSAQYKQRSSTGIFSPICKTIEISNLRKSTDDGIRYFDQKQELNIKLKNELLLANEQIANLEDKLKKSKEIILPECRNNSSLDRNLTGKSFDSARMKSTLHNMDIEEICRCFSRVIESQCLRQSEKANPVIKEFNSVFIEEQNEIPSNENVYN